MRQKFQPSRTRRGLKDTAREDATHLFTNYQAGPEGRIQVRTYTHRAYLAENNASRYLASLGSSPLLTPHWRVLARESYTRAFLDRLLELIDEVDHGDSQVDA